MKKKYQRKERINYGFKSQNNYDFEFLEVELYDKVKEIDEWMRRLEIEFEGKKRNLKNLLRNAKIDYDDIYENFMNGNESDYSPSKTFDSHITNAFKKIKMPMI